MPVLADAEQTDELVDGYVSILKLASRVGPPELRYRHADRGLRLALEMRGVLLGSEVDNRRSGCCFGDDHGRHMIAAPHDADPRRRAPDRAAALVAP